MSWLRQQREVIEQMTHVDMVAGLDDCAAVLKRKLESEERQLIENLERWKLDLSKSTTWRKRLQDEIKELEEVAKFISLSSTLRATAELELTARKKELVSCSAEVLHAKQEVAIYEDKLRHEQT